MPAHTCNIYHIHLYAIRLLSWFTNSDAVFFGQFFIVDILPKRIRITYANADHEIFSKGLVIVFL